MSESTSSTSSSSEPHKEIHPYFPPSSLGRRLFSNPTTTSVDETDDFYDPFSKLNLFLSKKIKLHIQKNGSPKYWSPKLQQELLDLILPDFKEKFPNYRIGLVALKKTFEKITYYHEKLKNQKEAILKTGEVNLSFLIKENLRTFLTYKEMSEVSPQTQANQLALKICECVAALDGVKVSVEIIAKNIYTSLYHLQKDPKKSALKMPYDDFDESDKLIIKTLLDCEIENPNQSSEELKEAIKSRLALYSLFRAPEKGYKIRTLTSALLGQSYKMGHALTLPESEIQTLEKIIKNNLNDGKKPTEIVQKLLGIKNLFNKRRTPTLSEEIFYQFLFVEQDDNTIKKEMKKIKNLPHFLLLKEEEAGPYLYSFFLEKAQKEYKSLISHELTSHFLSQSNPQFERVVTETLASIKKAKELCKNLDALLEKIEYWANQSELIYSILHFSPNMTLLKLIQEKREMSLDEITLLYIEKNPRFLHFAPIIRKKAAIIEKYLFYQEKNDTKSSSFDRFLIRQRQENLPELVRKKLPMIPFCPKYASKQIKSCKGEGKA